MTMTPVSRAAGGVSTGIENLVGTPGRVARLWAEMLAPEPYQAPSGPIRCHHRCYRASQLVTAKGTTTISVCLPALNEATTIGSILATIRRELMERHALVDELIVADDSSTDATASTARLAGATVVTSGLARSVPAGKGAAMRAALRASTGEVVVFLDADVKNFGPHFVTGLLGPLFHDRSVGFVKATYRRPVAGGLGEGGRVTELLAKPVLERLLPDLACFSQPLSGEIAARRWVIEGLVMPSGYGVDIALLADVQRRIGLDAIAEVDLGERVHRNRPLRELAPQSRAVLDAVLSRALGRERVPDPVKPRRTFNEALLVPAGSHHERSEVQGAARPFR